MIPLFREEVEQSGITVQIMLTEDQHATAQTAHGDESKSLVCSFFSVWLNHTAGCNREVGLNHCIGSGRFVGTIPQCRLY